MMPVDDALTRRGVLALFGTSAVAGCNSLRRLTDEREPTIEAYRLPDIDADGELKPRVPPSIPVDISPDYLAAGRDRTTALLATLPLPLGPSEIPNGYIRQELVDAAAQATDGIDAALDAETPFSALQSLRYAREDARYAAAGWAFVEDGLTVEAIRDEYEQAIADLQAFQADYAYVGADPVRAALVHARIETGLQRASDRRPTRPFQGDGASLLAVAAWGGATESVRTHLDDVQHLYEQFTSSLPADAGNVESRLFTIAKTLLTDVRSRRSTLPPEPTAEDWGPVEEITAEFRRSITYGPHQVADAAGPASAIVDATKQLTRLRALQRVQHRIDTGERFRVQGAEEVRTRRTTARTALRTALRQNPAPALARTVLTDAAHRIMRADRELARFDGDVTASRLADVVTEYVIGQTLAEATPAACRQTITAARSD